MANSESTTPCSHSLVDAAGKKSSIHCKNCSRHKARSFRCQKNSPAYQLLQSAETLHRSPHQELLPSRSSVKELRIERSPENAGHDRVHAHPGSCPFDRHRSSQGRERRLAGAIGGHFIESKERPKGCNVDDSAVAAIHHVAAKNLTGAQSARQVRFKNLVPFPFIGFQGRRR